MPGVGVCMYSVHYVCVGGCVGGCGVGEARGVRTNERKKEKGQRGKRESGI